MRAATASMADEKAADDLEAFNDVSLFSHLSHDSWLSPPCVSQAVSFVEGITGDKYPGDLWEYLKARGALVQRRAHRE